MPSQSVALPSSPTRSQTPPSLQPPWRPQHRSTSSGARRSSFNTSRTKSFRDHAINNLERLGRRTISTFSKMSMLQRLLAVLAFIILAALGILFLVFNEQIFGWLEPMAKKWKNTTGGWVILWAITCVVALPPLIGYSTCATTAGFVYGVWEGWLILASATVSGSSISFVLSRTLLRKYVERWTANDKRFEALTLTIKHDGLWLLCMIRLCPLPYSLSNGAMSTFPTVSPAMYALATAIITPKLLVHVFIGSRLAALADKGEKMSAGTRAINYGSIAIGMAVGLSMGWYIYQKTMARARQLEEEEEEASDAVRVNRRTGLPPRQYSDDPEAQTAAAALAQEYDEDDMDYFNDEATPGRDGYRDQLDSEDVFGKGDVDDDAPVIGLHSPKSQKCAIQSL